MSAIEEFFKTPLRQEFGKRLEKIMSLLEDAKAIEDPMQRKKDEGNYRRMLDKLYWEIFESICNDVIERDDVTYHMAEMIILNYGLLDHRQIVAPEPKEKKGDDEEQEEQLEIPDLETIEKRIKKFFVKSSYDDDPIYYMHEWAAMWQVNSELYMSSNKSSTQSEEEWLDDEKAHKYSQTRSNIYRKLHTNLEKLPGVNDNFLKILISGDFDRKIELAKVKSHLQPDDVTQSEKHLISIHSTLYTQLKASLKESEDLKLVFLLEKINDAIYQRRLKEEQVEAEMDEETRHMNSHEHIITREVKLIKNLLPIGGMEGKEFFTTPLLKEFNNPLNKVFVGDTMKLIRQCDPHIPTDLPVVIVPYKGSGFFEWDKNSLIVPVTPSLPPKEVIIRAVANYRILTDNLEHKGELKRQYERHLEKGGFKERFLHDYTQWVEHISQGHRKIMSLKKFDFFVEYVGPNRNKLMADGSLLYLSKYQIRKKITEMLTNSKMSQKDYYDLSVSYWLLEEYQKSDQYMSEAMTAGMPSPKILLAQGYIAQKILEKARAKQMFKNCVRFFKNSLYGAYAARELEKN